MFSKDGLLQLNPSPHSPLQIIARVIRPGTTILDVGCNTGMLGRLLHKSNTLDGIDINPQALKKAKPFYRHLYKTDLSAASLIKLHTKYDYIVMADILEHLPRPDLLLRHIKRFLKPNGYIVCSLPNIGRFEIRLKLLFGDFEYTASGILNQDHLRFFTQKSGLSLFENNSYQVIKTIPTGLGHRLGILPTITAFQFIFIAQHQ